MIKTIMTMVMLMAFATSAQAESVLMKMPYGMEFGKPLSAKIQGRSSAEKWKSDKNKVSYALPGKFKVVTNKGLVSKVHFLNDYTDKLPKKWRRLGLKICQPDVDGTSYQDALAIIQREGAKYIEQKKPYNMFYDTLRFEMGGKYAYEVFFLEHDKDNKAVKDCKGGLISIHISGDALGEDY